MRRQQRVARRVRILARIAGHAPTALLTERVLLVPQIPQEDVLIVVHLEVAPQQQLPPLVACRLVPFDRREELWLAGAYCYCLRLLRSLQRGEEMDPVPNDRPSKRTTVLVAPVLGLRCAADIVRFLFEPVHRVEAGIAEE